MSETLHTDLLVGGRVELWLTTDPGCTKTRLTVRFGGEADLSPQQLRDLAAALVQHADFIAQGVQP